MSSPNLDGLVEEINSALDTINPQIEGLHDFARLNLQDATKTVVNEATVDFERRRDLLSAANAALAALANDGYPEVSERDVFQAVHEDLQQNVLTIEAAFAKFRAIEEAVSAEIVAGEPERRPDV